MQYMCCQTVDVKYLKIIQDSVNLVKPSYIVTIGDIATGQKLKGKNTN